MPSRSDAVRLGAVALVPAIDPGLRGLSGRAGPVALLIVLGAVAVLALLVAAAAYGHESRRRSRTAVEDDSDLFTTTPLPMPKEELARMAAEAPHHAFREHRLPRWVQVGSLVAALVITWVVAGRLRPPGGAAQNDADSGTSAASDAEPTASALTTPEIPVEAAHDPDDPDGPAPFGFRALDWTVIGSGSGCAGRLEVTRGTPSGWNLVARVDDDRGALLDSARARVASLREGEVVEFAFARATCDRISTWDVQGERRSR